MGLEPQALHNGIVCNPGVTQDFIQPLVSESTKVMINASWLVDISISSI